MIIHIEMGGGLFVRVFDRIGSLEQVTYPVHGIVYKSSLIDFGNPATHPVVYNK